MNCAEFAERLTELARGRVPDDPEAMAHAGFCPACAARLAAERDVTAGLKALAECDALRAAPRRLEAALLDEFDRRNARRSPWRILTWASAGAAAAILAAIFLSPMPSPIPAPVAAWPAPQPPASALTIPVPPPSEPAAPARHAPRHAPAPAEYATGFIPLVEDAGLPHGPLPVMRMRLPRSILVSFGLPMSPDTASDTVDADVVLNDAGAARAIRFVSYAGQERF